MIGHLSYFSKDMKNWVSYPFIFYSYDITNNIKLINWYHLDTFNGS